MIYVLENQNMIGVQINQKGEITKDKGGSDKDILNVILKLNLCLNL